MRKLFYVKVYRLEDGKAGEAVGAATLYARSLADAMRTVTKDYKFPVALIGRKCD